MTTDLKFEALPSIHEDHQPVQSGALLLLRCVEAPGPFIKKGTSRLVRTGTKLIVPDGAICAVAQRDKHGDGFVLHNIEFHTPGISGEITLRIDAPPHTDRVVRTGEEIGAAWLFCDALLTVKPADVKAEPKVDGKTDAKPETDSKTEKKKPS